MELTLEYGANRDPEPIVEGLTAAGVRLDSKIRTETWPDDLELQAAGQLDFSRLYSAVRAVAAAICGKQDLIPVRIFRDPDVADLLYSVPCDDIERAATELSHDIRTYSDEADPFRSWFRGQWMGMLDEYSLTEQELASAPLTAELILEYLDPPINRDWRPIQNYIARKATCDQLSEAMATAVTSRQKSRLATHFTAVVGPVKLRFRC